MQRTRFDRLHTVRLAHEGRNGRVEVCRTPDGAWGIRLQVRSPACQQELLSGLDESVPARLENGALEVLLPWQEGIPLRQWIYEETPTLGQRRDACLSLLEQQVELHGKLPPCLTALSAAAENLAVAGRSMSLRYLPELQRWEPGMGEAQAVRALASVICGVLACKPEPWAGGRIPEEFLLLKRRQEERDYSSLGQLQSDVAAIPDVPPRRGSVLRPYIQRVRSWLRRYGEHLLRILAALLLTAALLSLASAYRRYGREHRTTWQGMPQVGGQDLRDGEGGG